jgi:hypothetical protein
MAPAVYCEVSFHALLFIPRMSATVVKRSGISTIVGLLACQTDSYMKTIRTTVVSCEKPVKGDGYEVELKDTVLFPEGKPFDFYVYTCLFI